MSEWENKYEVLEKIGHGSFGVIRKVRRKADGMVLCRKEISYLKMSQKEREQLHAEFQILSSLRHPNIVGYFHREHLKQSQDLHLYMEYCGNGDLGRVIQELVRTNKYAEEEFVWVVFSQLVTALYRCHYGINPPEVGNNVLAHPRLKPKIPSGAVTILHRDLKPENVFLGENNSVKLGDFGLSKMIQSHDFASTYVGTPFYMSPEICAAERYTLKSDIWSLGCVIYELCAREPPFNAKTHFQLVQKIKEGRVGPLPPIYSEELRKVIKDCLRVNPDLRPDTAALLNLPIVRLMRTQREAVELRLKLARREADLEKKTREVNQKVEELERGLAKVEAEKSLARQEIEASLRREWEVRARLEIDRIVASEFERLKKHFEIEVQGRVQEELLKKHAAVSNEEAEASVLLLKNSEYPQSLAGASTDGEFPSTTDITEFSVNSSDEAPLKKESRAPFGRAQTMFERNGHAGTPMDVDMASPSPIAIASLSLSPRRANSTKAPGTKQPIFDETADEARWRKARNSDPVLSDSEDDDTPPIPSPTRGPRNGKHPFTNWPVLPAVKSTATNAVRSQSHTPDIPPSLQSRALPCSGVLRERGSPNRRLSKIPSVVNLGAPTGENGLQRKPSLNKKESDVSITRAAVKNLKGRTLIELHARNGGRQPEHNKIKERSVDRSLEPVAVWDPEKDEMPSPFLVRQRPLSRA